MKIFQCGNCNQDLYFENYQCENCGHASGYRHQDRKMLTFNTEGGTALVSDRENKSYAYCKNQAYKVCNWLVESDDSAEYCIACQLNKTIPDLSDAENFDKWRNLEIAKHRLVYQLLKLGLSLPGKNNTGNGLKFDFVAKQEGSEIMTGHANGLITILLSEADSVQREKLRKQFLEPYRTLIGHLRHEVGHYFWDQLVVTNADLLHDFRSVFGDERQDYGKALKDYYKAGAPVNWQKSFISRYATSHPWEDWAETWAHYLHIMDMVETAYFFGINVKQKKTGKKKKLKVSFDPYGEAEFDAIINVCIPLSFAVNSINRAMGVPDVYPFVITDAVVDKLKFIHRLLLSKRV